mmetsp:Transcript_100588/g.224626  ORF Transcript_100588/g.224626 Transcript_100588/m.224626 type:complete len:469 (-) Transcript_100588:77-1483(-)
MERLAVIAKHVSVSATVARDSALVAQPTAASPIIASLKGKISVLLEKKLAQKAALLKNGEAKIQDVTVEMAINGARSIKAMVTDTSDLDAMTGIAYRGKSLYECNKELPKAPGGEAGLPEAAFWLLLTGEVPSAAETQAFTDELHRRSQVPPVVMEVIKAMPKGTHPMTQLATGILAMQPSSLFAQKYDEGMKKNEYWEYTLEDALDLIARIPTVAAFIYSHTFKDGSAPKYNEKLDWAGNFAGMLGVNSEEGFKEATRLYLMLHADHEGGNVSAHTTHLVGSALSDPYYSWAAGICGLAGPLHGLANQECLSWLMEVQQDLKGQTPTPQLLTDYAEKTLASGKVIPGFGHAVLRNTDPRYMLEREFALKHCKDDPLFKLVDAVYQSIPPLLEKLGKVKNPYPNVDAHSGQLMHFYNLKEPNFYTVVFAVSRSLGVMAQLVWARAIGLPIERPKSVPLDVLTELTKGK